MKLFLLAAAGLALSACAHPGPERGAMVFLSGPGQYVIPDGAGGTRVVVINGRTPSRSLIAGDRYYVQPLSRAEHEMLARLSRDARLRADEARRLGEVARQRGAEARRLGEEARVRGEEARRRGEEARARGEDLRRRAEGLREQCERGEIQCERDGGVFRFRDGDQEIILVR